MFFQKKNYFCFLDIGSTKTACLICNIVNNKILPVSWSFVGTRGMRAGKIYDARELRSSILAAIYEAEQKISVHVDNVVVNLPNIECIQKTVVVSDYLSGKQVLKEDIKKLISQSQIQIDSSKNEVIHHFPVRFCLDDVTVVKNPEGLFADRIEAEINLVYTSLSYLVNVATILAGCHLKPEDFILNSYASALAVCREEEFNKLIVIDFGGDSISIVHFLDQTMNEISSVRIGSNNITKDIAAYFSISFQEAERIKTVYGDLLSNDESSLIHIKQFSSNITDEPNSIKKAMLNMIIRARIEEITELVSVRIAKLDFKNIIITGGGSKLNGLAEIFSSYFKCPVECRDVITKIGVEELERDPSFATLLGMATYVTKNKNMSAKSSVAINPIYKILNWLKENF